MATTHPISTPLIALAIAVHDLGQTSMPFRYPPPSPPDFATNGEGDHPPINKTKKNGKDVVKGGSNLDRRQVLLQQFWALDPQMLGSIVLPPRTTNADCGEENVLVLTLEDQLRFVFLPLRLSNKWKEQEVGLDMFSVVFVLDASHDSIIEASRAKLSTTPTDTSYGRAFPGSLAYVEVFRTCVASLSSALLYAELADGYVTREARRIVEAMASGSKLDGEVAAANEGGVTAALTTTTMGGTVEGMGAEERVKSPYGTISGGVGGSNAPPLSSPHRLLSQSSNSSLPPFSEGPITMTGLNHPTPLALSSPPLANFAASTGAAAIPGPASTSVVMPSNAPLSTQASSASQALPGASGMMITSTAAPSVGGGVQSGLPTIVTSELIPTIAQLSGDRWAAMAEVHRQRTEWALEGSGLAREMRRVFQELNARSQVEVRFERFLGVSLSLQDERRAPTMRIRPYHALLPTVAPGNSVISPSLKRLLEYFALHGASRSLGEARRELGMSSEQVARFASHLRHWKLASVLVAFTDHTILVPTSRVVRLGGGGEALNAIGTSLDRLREERADFERRFPGRNLLRVLGEISKASMTMEGGGGIENSASTTMTMDSRGAVNDESSGDKTSPQHRQAEERGLASSLRELRLRLGRPSSSNSVTSSSNSTTFVSPRSLSSHAPTMEAEEKSLVPSSSSRTSPHAGRTGDEVEAMLSWLLRRGYVQQWFEYVYFVPPDEDEVGDEVMDELISRRKHDSDAVSTSTTAAPSRKLSAQLIKHKSSSGVVEEGETAQKKKQYPAEEILASHHEALSRVLTPTQLSYLHRKAIVLSSSSLSAPGREPESNTVITTSSTPAAAPVTSNALTVFETFVKLAPYLNGTSHVAEIEYSARVSRTAIQEVVDRYFEALIVVVRGAS